MPLLLSSLVLRSKRQSLVQPSPLGSPSQRTTFICMCCIKGTIRERDPQCTGASVVPRLQAVSRPTTSPRPRPRHLPCKQDPHLSGGREESALNKAQLEEVTHQQLNTGLIPAGRPTSLKGKEPASRGEEVNTQAGRCSHTRRFCADWPCYWCHEL